MGILVGSSLGRTLGRMTDPIPRKDYLPHPLTAQSAWRGGPHLPEVVDEYALQPQRGGNLRVKVPRLGWPASLEVAALADLLDVPDARAQEVAAARLNELAGSS